MSQRYRTRHQLSSVLDPVAEPKSPFAKAFAELLRHGSFLDEGIAFASLSRIEKQMGLKFVFAVARAGNLQFLSFRRLNAT